MMEVIDLLQRMKEQDVDIDLEGDDIEVRCYGKEIPDRLYKEIYDNKEAIVTFLKEHYTLQQISGISPLVRGNNNPYYDITPQQRKEFARFLIVGEYGYNTCMDLELSNPDPVILEAVFDTLFQRHESLRTTFLRIDGEMKQYIHQGRPPGFFIEYIDVRNQDDGWKMGMELYHQLPKMPLNFETGPLIIVKLIRLTDDIGYLLVAIHHVHSDHQSLEIVKSEVRLLYESYKAGKGNPLPAQKIQYKDYAHWVNQLRREEIWKQKADSYRRKILDSAKGSLGYIAGGSYRKELQADLTTLLNKQDIGEYSFAFGTLVNLIPNPGASYTTFMDEALVDGLKKLAVDSKVSLFTVLMSAYSIVFSRLNEDPNVRIYLPVSTRIFEEMQNMVGWLTGELILCVNVESGARLKDLINIVNKAIVEDSECRFYPYEQLMYELDIPLSILSPICLNFISNPGISGGGLVSQHGGRGDGHFNFKCTMVEYSNGISLNCEFNKKIYAPWQIELMIKEYNALLETAISGNEHS